MIKLTWEFLQKRSTSFSKNPWKNKRSAKKTTIAQSSRALCDPRSHGCAESAGKGCATPSQAGHLPCNYIRVYGWIDPAEMMSVICKWMILPLQTVRLALLWLWRLCDPNYVVMFPTTETRVTTSANYNIYIYKLIFCITIIFKKFVYFVQILC